MPVLLLLHSFKKRPVQPRFNNLAERLGTVAGEGFFFHF